MDLSARPKLLKISDVKIQSIEPAKNHVFGGAETQLMSSFPIGKISNNSKIFIFSTSCGDSANQFIEEIVPRIKSGESILLANMLRHDPDLNVWTRIFKLKAEYRMVLVAQIFKEFYDKNGLSMDGIHKVIDKYLSSVPLQQAYSGYSPEKAALSGIVTSIALKNFYNVSATPVLTQIK
ncbi:hypothetical protein C1Y41_18780 [Pantoea sp. ICBG 1758]|uniref:hypothetical protein n=1 Tax=Pantoea sp. ICBG 1758 TaxID=2071682 RepID=UPI000CE374AA|nr:hypothetical protein [Pantoea sp. ICBG 1758]PPC61276.1 hypothetical protein C1Y41_18780 [Pantoea sp. ICBG 1758]